MFESKSISMYSFIVNTGKDYNNKKRRFEFEFLTNKDKNEKKYELFVFVFANIAI